MHGTWITANTMSSEDYHPAHLGVLTRCDLKIASRNVDGLDSNKFEKNLANVDTQGIGEMVLQGTRCSTAQARQMGGQLKKRMGRQAKLFNVEGPTALNSNCTPKAVRVGGQMFLTDHKIGVYTNNFLRDPTGLGVLSSITISSKAANLSIKIIPIGHQTMS